MTLPRSHPSTALLADRVDQSVSDGSPIPTLAAIVRILV